MAFRFRKSIGPKWLKMNLTANGVSSVSVGGRGLKVNAPVNRKGGVRVTAGIPGSGMSWSEQLPDDRQAPEPTYTQKPGPGALQTLMVTIGLFCLMAVGSLIDQRNKEIEKAQEAADACLQGAGPSTCLAVDIDQLIDPATAARVKEKQAIAKVEREERWKRQREAREAGQ